MQVTVRISPGQEPLFNGKGNGWIEIRDGTGMILLVILFLPGGRAFLTSGTNDEDFDDFLANICIPKFREDNLGRTSISIHDGPLKEPAVFPDASMVELRDEQGNLAMFVLYFPQGDLQVCEKTSDIFLQAAGKLGITMRVCPPDAV